MTLLPTTQPPPQSPQSTSSPRQQPQQQQHHHPSIPLNTCRIGLLSLIASLVFSGILISNHRYTTNLLSSTTPKNTWEPSTPPNRSDVSIAQLLTQMEFPNRHHRHLKHPHIVLLAGPHKTGTSSIQTNLWNWTASSTNNYLPHWKWPVPPMVSQLESSDTKAWNWTPSKGFYPLLESIQMTMMGQNATKDSSARSIFQQYTPMELQDLFRSELTLVNWKKYNVVMGSEAVDLIVKSPKGDFILDGLGTILPTNIPVTCVIVYRIPKIRHLVSMWHQNEIKNDGAEFWAWITTTQNTLGAMDALGMVSMVLERTSWDVVLVDAHGAKEAGWDISNLVTCSILASLDESIECDESEKSMIVEGNVIQPIIKNVRSNKRPPNVGEQVLQDMDQALRSYDCNYLDLMKGGVIGWNEMIQRNANQDTTTGHRNLGRTKIKQSDRLRVLFPLAINEIIQECEENEKRDIPATRIILREKLAQMAFDSRQHDE